MPVKMVEAATLTLDVPIATTTASTTLKTYDTTLCSCVAYLLSLGLNIPPVSAEWYKSFPHSPPIVGSIAVFSYGEGEDKQHIAEVIALNEETFTIREANFHRCSKDIREVSYSDEHLVGFFNPQYSRIPDLIAEQSSIYGEQGKTLIKIADAESEMYPYAQNASSTAKGLFQILDSTAEAFQCDGDMLDPESNIRCAVKIAYTSGLHHWQASESKWGN